MVERSRLARASRLTGGAGLRQPVSFVPEPPPMSMTGPELRAWSLRQFEQLRRVTDELDRRLRELEP